MKLSRLSSGWIVVFVIGLGTVVGPGHAIGQRALGTDVSHYQGSGINWTTVKNDGISFAWAKATEGTDFIDPDFTVNENNAKAAGVPIGGYDFALPADNTPSSEAAYFWNEVGSYVKADGLTIMPMLDYETFGGTIDGASSYSAWANGWCDTIVTDATAAGLGVTPVIYIGPCNTESYLNNSVKQWLNNIAVYPGNPNPQAGNPWSSSSCTSDPAWGGAWNIWQYADTNPSGGDSDVFNGTESQMTATLVVGGGNGNPTGPSGDTVYWDPGAKDAPPGSGGTGNWDTTTDNWWLNQTGDTVWSTGGDYAEFSGTAGTVTLAVNISADGLAFIKPGYVITGTSALAFSGTNPVISVPTGIPTYIDCMLTGSNYQVTGGGVLVLDNIANSSVSPTLITNATTLVIASSGALGGGSGTVTISGGSTLQNNDPTNGDAFLNSSLNIVMGTGGGNLNDNTNASLFYGGVISGSGSLAKIGGGGGTGGTLILNGVNTYSGSTTISQGVLALGSTGSINNSSMISIAAGAAFDVSAIASYTLSGNSTLSASGTASAAAIKGGTTVNLGSQPIILAFNGSTHPALTISQGTLSLNGNAFTVNRSTTLPVGVYTIVQQTSGNITSSGSYTVAGTAIGAAGTTAAISVSSGSVILTIAHITTTTLNSLTSSTYGQSVTFTAAVAPTPSGGTVQFYDNGVPLGAPVIVSSGQAYYSTNTLSVGNHPITASYSGTTGYAASATTSSSTQQVTLPPNSAPVTITNVTLLGNGTVQMNFQGIAGYTYLIQVATNLTPPITWTSLSTNTADINGLFNFTDLTATNFHSRYYQTMVQ